ncbi:MAG: hypothetical protein ACRC0F_03670 [Cetobacterium sp.]
MIIDIEPKIKKSIMEALEKSLERIVDITRRAETELNGLSATIEEINITQIIRAEDVVDDLGDTARRAENELEDIAEVIDDIDDNGIRRAEDAVDDLGDEAKKTEKEIKGIGSAIKAVGAMALTYLSFEGIIGGINLASDFEETRNKLGAVFDGQLSDLDSFISEMNNTLGTGKGDLELQASNMGAILKGMGFGGDELMKMTKNFMMAGADLSSFHNKTAGEMETIMKGVLSGETEGARSIGIDLMDASMDEYASKKGMNWKDLDNNNKTRLRTNKFMEATSTQGAKGDASKTADGFANASKAVMSNAKDAYTKLFTGITEKISPILANLRDLIKDNMDNFVKAGESIGDFIGDVIKGVKSISSFVKENKELVTIVGKVVLVIGAAVQAYNGVIKVIKIWQGVQVLLNATMALNPIGLVVAGIALFVGGVIVAYQHCEGFKSAVDALWVELKGLWEAITSFDIGAFYEKTISVAIAYLNVFKSVWQGLFDLVSNFWLSLTGWDIGAVVAGWYEKVAGAMAKIRNVVSDIIFEDDPKGKKDENIETVNNKIKKEENTQIIESKQKIELSVKADSTNMAKFVKDAMEQKARSENVNLGLV